MKRVILLVSLICAGFIANAQCDYGSHSVNWEDAWLSCSVTDNPNPERGQSHWIMYDLGSPHAFFESWIWNYNVSNETGLGMRNCYFDFSLDGENWTNWGTLEVDQAPGNSDYSGVAGPYFDGAVGRYLLITMDTNWDGTGCRGFAEIKVDVEDTTVDIEEASIEFNVFPNPANDQVTIRHYAQGDALTLQIKDTSGRTVFNDQLYGSTGYVNVNRWESGLYFVVLQNEAGVTAVKRLIVR